MRYPINDKFWGWRMDPFEVFAHWDSWRTSPNLTLTLADVIQVIMATLLSCGCTSSLWVLMVIKYVSSHSRDCY